ncbi:MAG TPA: hypothetical protein VFS52_13465 [Steroidobacteraceae bacterium]|nr:hypothetical protein [Steroidobacteraceae bacterium]
MSSATLDEVPIEMREPEERRIAWTVAVSVLLHIGLLLLLSAIAVPSIDLRSLPDLTFNVSLDDGHDTEHDNSPAVERSAAPTTTVSETQPAAIADNAPSEIEPPPVVASASPAPEPREAPTEESLSPVSIPSQEAEATENTEILTTSAPSEVSVPVSAAPPEPEVVETAIPAQEQALLTKKVMEGARGFQDTTQNEAHLSWTQDGQEYTAVLTRQPAADNTGIDRMIVEVVTEERGKRLRTKMQMKRLAFSHFTQLVDRWDDEVQLHDDEIVGRFHSNSEILVGYDHSATPRFFGKVTTAARGFTFANAVGRKERAEIFRAGLETRAGRIPLPAKFLPFAAQANPQQVEVQSYQGDTRITFYEDGTYGWKPAKSKGPEQRQRLGPTTTYIVGTRDTTFYIRGTVNGKVLVYSPDLIVVEGHLVYAHDPRADAKGDDYLGLVSDNYIEVARHSVTGPGDLEIDAAIYAKRRFVVTDEHAPGNATLFIYGSLTAGTLSATEPRYATKVTFDPRFEDTRPPGFPVTDRYEMDSWDGMWKVSDDP